jgi:hypothetical protein
VPPVEGTEVVELVSMEGAVDAMADLVGLRQFTLVVAVDVRRERLSITCTTLGLYQKRQTKVVNKQRDRSLKKVLVCASWPWDQNQRAEGFRVAR